MTDPRWQVVEEALEQVSYFAPPLLHDRSDDPTHPRALAGSALAALHALREEWERIEEVAHDHRFSDEYLGNVVRSRLGRESRP